MYKQKYDIGTKVFCMVITSIPSAADLFGRWLVLPGSVISAFQSLKHGIVYEVEIDKLHAKKYFNKQEIVVPESRVFLTRQDVKKAMFNELKRVFLEEKEAIENLFK